MSGLCGWLAPAQSVAPADGAALAAMSAPLSRFDGAPGAASLSAVGGVAVAAITRRHQGYVLAHVEGLERPLLNGTAITATPVPLKHGDRLQLAGTEMQFEQA